MLEMKVERLEPPENVPGQTLVGEPVATNAVSIVQLLQEINAKMDLQLEQQGISKAEIMRRINEAY